jgi:hypothetical protein
MRSAAGVAVLLLASAACSTRPTPSPGLVAMERNPRVTVSGVVVDSETGLPVEGIEVTGLPEGKDYPWVDFVRTGADGAFTLSLPTPARYAFLLRWKEISIVTPDPGDPAYVDVETREGNPVEGVRLKFFRTVFETPQQPASPPPESTRGR